MDRFFDVKDYVAKARAALKDKGGPEMLHSICQRLKYKRERNQEEEERLQALEGVLHVHN